MAKVTGVSEFGYAKHTIDTFLISAMALNEKSVTIYNREDGNGKECPLYGDVHADIKDWYESLYFEWEEIEDIITITWG